MPIALLSDRAVISVTGEDAAGFLDGLFTCAVEPGGAARYGALLTPQGKIIADFFLVAQPEGGLLIDVAAAVAADLLRRLTLYRLRAKVAIADRSSEFLVFAAWGAAPEIPAWASAFADPRLATLGLRLIAPTSGHGPIEGAPVAEYEAHRISLVIPQGGSDFVYGDAFPHEAALDQLTGVDFGKGCYVGQEIVSRMEHRGTARTRLAGLSFHGPAPIPGAEIVAGDQTLGRVGSVAASGRQGIGLLRLDRLSDALAAGREVSAGGATLTAAKPPWARYAFPGGERAAS